MLQRLSLLSSTSFPAEKWTENQLSVHFLKFTAVFLVLFPMQDGYFHIEITASNKIELKCLF